MPPPVDIAIIGGGVIGCAIAWRLAQTGASCAIIERAQLANNASGATAGIIAPLWHLPPDNPPLFQLGLRSLQLFPQWATQLTDHGINPEYQQTGILRIALTQPHAHELAQTYQWQSRLNLNVQWLTPDDLRQREPQANPQALAAIYSPQEGNINGQRLTQALAHAAAQHGAAIYENTPATGLQRTGNRITAIQTPIGPIPAQHIILAAGPWSGPAGPWRNIDIKHLPIRGVKGQRILLRQPGFLPKSTTHNFTGYISPRPNGTILIASTREENQFNQTITADALTHLITLATRAYPILARANFIAARAGIRPATPDNQPIIGPHPTIENLTIATGHDAVGIMLSPATAELTAQYIQDRNPAPLHPFTPNRFPPNPPTRNH